MKALAGMHCHVPSICCSVLQCVAVCCSVLQCVAVCCSVSQMSAGTCWYALPSALLCLLQPLLPDSTSSCCCTFSSNFCVVMAEQLCSPPWRNNFVEGNIWDFQTRRFRMNVYGARTRAYTHMQHARGNNANRTLQHNATQCCNTLQRTATHCNTLPHTATHCHTLQHTATHCNTLQHTATHYNTLQLTTTHCNTLQHTATHCTILQHAATHCNEACN